MLWANPLSPTCTNEGRREAACSFLGPRGSKHSWVAEVSFGTVGNEDDDNLSATMLAGPEGTGKKQNLVGPPGPDRGIALGNGANDRFMPDFRARPVAEPQAAHGAPEALDHAKALSAPCVLN